MSWIGNNLLNAPFSGFPAQSPQTGLGQSGPGAPAPPLAQSDVMIAGFPGTGAFAGGSEASLAGGGGGLSAMMSGFATYVNGLFNQIAAWYGSGTSNQSGAAGGNPQSPSGPGAPGQSPAPFGQSEAYFENASATSWGDPHDSFNGTEAGGQSVNGSWDNMRSHADLLDSNSFAGGYRVSTQVTQPNAQGITMNQSASISTDNGNNVVSLNASGQYQISSYGNNVTLQPGQTAQLDGGESVTLNGDGSLTVTDTNASGGRITTTLKTNGDGGVDVKAEASGVDLGGYLVSRADGAGPQPVWPGNPQPIWPGSPQPVAPSYPLQPGSPILRPHPDSANAAQVESPFEQIDQIVN